MTRPSNRRMKESTASSSIASRMSDAPGSSRLSYWAMSSASMAQSGITVRPSSLRTAAVDFANMVIGFPDSASSSSAGAISKLQNCG